MTRLLRHAAVVLLGTATLLGLFALSFAMMVPLARYLLETAFTTLGYAALDVPELTPAQVVCGIIGAVFWGLGCLIVCDVFEGD